MTKEELENDLVMVEAILEAVDAALRGEEVSEFMESFPVVARAKVVYAQNFFPRPLTPNPTKLSLCLRRNNEH